VNRRADSTLPRTVWRAATTPVAAPGQAVRASGFAALDAVLPGGGWPCGALTDWLLDGPAALVWRLAAPALARLARTGSAPPRVALIGPPQAPHAPGLGPCLPLWIDAPRTAERLWAAEQVLAAHACVAVLVWLTDARPEALRRLHLRAGHGQALLLACRPAHAAAQPCAAPLRLHLSAAEPWWLDVHLFKRPGPPLAQPLRLPSVPPVLAARMAPAWRHGPGHTGQPAQPQEATDVVRLDPPRRRA